MSGKLKYVLLLLMALAGTFRVSGQIAMPDDVCVGATKHYWVDSTASSGSTFNWMIDGVTVQDGPVVLFKHTWLTTVGSPFIVSVIETSADGCAGVEQSGQVNVLEQLPVSVALSVDQNPVCFGESVIFTATPVNGGTDPVFSWFVNGTPVPIPPIPDNSYTFTPVGGETVYVQLTSNLECTITPVVNSDVIVIDVITLAAPLASVTGQPTCLIPTGTIVVTDPAEGTGFNYSIDDGATWLSTATFAGLIPGTYNVTVQEIATGCVSAPTVLTVDPAAGAPPAPVASVTVQPTCLVPTGTIVVTDPAEGTGFNYSIDNGATWLSTATFAGLIPGTYNVTVQEIATGCVSPATVLTIDPVPGAPLAPIASVTV